MISSLGGKIYMTTKNKLITATLLSASAITTIAAINKYIKLSAVSKNVLASPSSNCYHWRFGDIYYTKCGNGRPLLLIHDLHAASCGYQWNQIIPALSNHYTVYTIDLLGCGRSEKPYLTYTNYLYVQLISDFIKSEIGHRTDVIASGNSGCFVLMACNNSPELFNRLMLVNPDSVSSCSHMPGRYSKLYKGFLDFPVIGTLIYHIAYSKKSLLESFKNDYFYNPHAVKESYITAYYEAAHLGYSPKSVYASVHCSYTNCNIVNALKKIDNSIYLIGGACLPQEKELLEEYTNYNPAIEYALIPDVKLLPQMEKPVQLLTMIHTYFS